MSIDYLAQKNPHPRDSRITFDEGPHIYTIDGHDSGYTSVTTWNHTHFDKFDADKIISGMMKSKNWPQSKYYGMERDEIKAGWEENRDSAAAAGTKMHYDIECFYNNCPRENNSVEYKYFNNFHDRVGKKMKPYRTEWEVFHEELRLSGSIDMIYENDDGTLSIYDWKRCKEIVKVNSWAKFANNEIISHFPDTNYWHYCLQLNIYKYILEAKYGKKVTDLFLVCFHPDNKNGDYIMIRVMNIQNEIEELFKERLQMLK